MQDDPINFYQSMISIDLTTMLRYATLLNRPQKPVGRSLFIGPEAKSYIQSPVASASQVKVNK